MTDALGQYVLKVHSRCDLACDHCYMYEHADQSWRSRPVFMSPETVRQAAARIAEHAAAHRLPRVGVVLHGGEPLLLGPGRLRAVLAELYDTITPICPADLRMQSNGVRLDQDTCDVLAAYGVQVGISLDGGRAANDRHRRFRTGATSHPQTLRALRLLRAERNRGVYAGILCTVDVANDPGEVYDALIAEDPPRIDLLLPHATWEHPPAAGDYAAWLLSVHSRWTADGRRVPIRLFDSIRSLAAGGRSLTEAVGPDTGGVVVIETDGAWEQPDSMKTTFHGAGTTGLTVAAHSADEVNAHPAFRRRRGGLAGLCATCRACPVVDRCGGGMVAHRYHPETGFDNPSVYCRDLKELIIAMDDRTAGVLGTVPEAAFDRLATGFGDAAAVAVLAEAELAINRALVSEVAAKHPAPAAWELLTHLEGTAPELFADVLAHPFVRPWAVHCLTTGGSDAARLAALAAAVAIRAGVAAEIVVTAPAGRVHLPTVGTFPATGEFTVVAGPDGFAAPPGWRPARTVGAGGLRVLLEDTDPYRDCHDFAVTGALTAAEADSWAHTLSEAWPRLRADAPEQAGGLARGLRALTPLRPAVNGDQRSATARDAFGAAGVAHVADPDAVVVMLVHEFQHSKLGALLDLHDLIPAGAEDLIRVGWRPDPRPVEAALQGTYAHLGVADVWRHRAVRRPDDTRAAANFATYRGWTAAAITELRTGNRLTATGAAFVDRMAATVDGWAG